MLRLQDNPPRRWPEEHALADSPGTWWIAHTRARFEKAFAWDLVQNKVPYFLPMVVRTTVSGGRKRRGMMPLFPSYVFINGDNSAREIAFSTNRICQVMRVLEQDQLIRELTALELAIEKKIPLEPLRELPTGARCRIRYGALAGQEGTVIDQRESARVVLQVSMIGQGAVLEIERDLIELI